MKKWKRGMSLVLALAMSAALALPIRALDPLADNFAVVHIDAKSSNAPTQTLQVELYRRNEAGQFQVNDSVRYECSINRAAGNVSFLIKPNAKGVWAEVDYLTDLNGDGVYEMLDGGTEPVSDMMTTSSQLVPWDGEPRELKNGTTYMLSAKNLVRRAEAALEARNTVGDPLALPSAGGELPPVETVLYYVTLHYLSPVDQVEYTMGYYLQTFDTVLMPSDVPLNAWYAENVEYALREGLVSGTGPDTFSPQGMVTRAQLAQILWRLGGSKLCPAADSFSDVATTDWYYDAVNWCSQEGLMSGTGSGFQPNGTLTREQLALVLMKYAQWEDRNTNRRKELDHFADSYEVSTWAVDGLEWATACGLLSGYTDGTLRPNSGSSRAELVTVLRSFCENIL